MITMLWWASRKTCGMVMTTCPQCITSFCKANNMLFMLQKRPWMAEWWGEIILTITIQCLLGKDTSNGWLTVCNLKSMWQWKMQDWIMCNHTVISSSAGWVVQNLVCVSACLSVWLLMLTRVLQIVYHPDLLYLLFSSAHKLAICVLSVQITDLRSPNLHRRCTSHECTNRCTSGLAYFSWSQTSKCKNPNLHQPGQHKS